MALLTLNYHVDEGSGVQAALLDDDPTVTLDIFDKADQDRSDITLYLYADEGGAEFLTALIEQAQEALDLLRRTS